mgnify:CR=1 FL=1
MTEKFMEELEDLRLKTIRMGELSRSMLEDSIKSLLEQDRGLAEKAYSRKDEVRRMDQEIEEEALHLIALHQPVAKDLRTIGCILKIITYITRIGRYGKDIANITLESKHDTECDCTRRIPLMAEKTNSMIRDSLRAFEKRELGGIRDFSMRDDEIDKLRYDVYRDTIDSMKEGVEIRKCSDVSMIARYLERCADNACKIAEKTHYMVTGEHFEIS